MPRCWRQSGDEYIRNNYLDDPIPLKVQCASDELDQLLEKFRKQGITLLLSDEPIYRYKISFKTFTPQTKEPDDGE